MVQFNDQIIIFVGSLLIGAFGVYVGALVVTEEDRFSKALLTALIGAIVWAVASFFFLGVPYLGPLLTLAAYLFVIYWQYEVSWPKAIGIALLAWIVGLGVLSVLSTIGFGSLEAMGIPRFGR